MAQRLKLQQLLETITDHVYFQPPENVAMVYPCIVYKRDARNTDHADNKPYAHAQRYSVIVIDRDPDSDIVEKVAALPTSSYSTHYTADDLNHDVFNVFF